MSQEDFDAKVAFVKSWTYGGSKVTNDEKLTCYGLYKQVTVGDITDAQPWAVQIEARAKWNAWNSRKGMSKEEAISTYIAEVDAQHAKYGDGP
jgi:acyl-CoA-binding protein|mmetsp:Transcript_15901/g.54943  ORF Transcript_15901/g.54943 Transcript_15901/m.54943 type:complete len:93 (+) Transcript_15901:82-360(+)